MKNKTGAASAMVKSQVNTRDNNFSIIRLTATLFVFMGHMGEILGMQPPYLGGLPIYELGVMLLFLISGYLITQSWLSDPHPLHFAIRRFFRLWPPFAAMVLIMVFVTGPFLSELGIQGYFDSWYKTYLDNLRFYIVYAQPGVFTDLPVANATNGSLWTMPVEAALYILTPLLLTALKVKSRSQGSFRLTAVLAAVTVGFDLCLRTVFAGSKAVFYATDWVAAFHLITIYVIGMFYTYEEVRKYLNLQVGCVAMCLILFTQIVFDPMQHLLFYLVFSHFVFSFVFAPKPLFKNFCRKTDLSYGIYLYGFFFQQLMVSWQQKNRINLGYMGTFFASLLLTLGASLLSWYLVEKPSQQIGRFLISKLRKRENAKRC